MYSKICVVCKEKYDVKADKPLSKFCSHFCYRKYGNIYNSKGLLHRNEEGQLVCTACDMYKDETDFYVDIYHVVEARNGRASVCKMCHSQRGKKYRNKNKSNIDYILRNRLAVAKSSSKSRGIVFDGSITVDYLLNIYKEQNGNCAFSGVKMTIGEGKRVSTTLSLDRKDSKQGYVYDNVQLVCWAVNQMKSDLSKKELLFWCEKLINYENEKTALGITK